LQTGTTNRPTVTVLVPLVPGVSGGPVNSKVPATDVELMLVTTT